MTRLQGGQVEHYVIDLQVQCQACSYDSSQEYPGSLVRCSQACSHDYPGVVRPVAEILQAVIEAVPMLAAVHQKFPYFMEYNMN